MRKKAYNELRAGAFVLAGVVVFTAAIFLLGQKSALFSRTTDLYVDFKDISGLVVGAPVRLSGLEIGSVGAISFPEDLARKEARVRLVVQTRYMDRIRKNSEAFIDSNGLLGDKVVNISMGDPKFASLQDGATLPAGKTVTFESLSTNIDKAIRSIVSITEAADSLLKDGETSQLKEDVGRIAHSLANVLSEVEKGHGLAHRVLYDKQSSADFGTLLSESRRFAEKARRATERVEAVLAEVETGDGTLHGLVYDQQGTRALASIGAAAAEIEEVVRAVRDGNGVLHTLLYDEEKGNFLRELNQMSATLRRIVDDVDKGRGTLGGLLRDPTVYEDLKTVLGNIERNVVFKALVRFTVKEDDLRRSEDAPAARPQAK